MAFDALDAQLRQLQGSIVRDRNQGLSYGGTTRAEYDFLAKAALDNTAGPNFYSFMAGVSAGNLAQQDARQQQYDRAKELRDLNSQLTYRDAQTRLTHANAAGQEATNPFIPDAQQTDIGYKRSQIDLTAANAIQQYNANPYVADAAQADINYKRSQTELTAANAIQQRNANPYVADTAQAELDYKRSQADQMAIANAFTPAEMQTKIAANNAQIERQRLENPYIPAEMQTKIAANNAAIGKVTGPDNYVSGWWDSAPSPQPATAPHPAASPAANTGAGQKPVLSTGIELPLRNTILRLEADSSYVPSVVEQQAMREYQAYLAAGGIPLNLR